MKKLGLKGYEMAEHLRITPEWLSRILNGKVQVSHDVELRLDDLLRRRGIDLKPLDVASTSVVHEEAPPYNMGSSLSAEKKVRAAFDDLLSQTAGEPDRLTWLLEELRRLQRRVPDHWEPTDEEFEARLAAARAHARRGLGLDKPGRGEKDQQAG